eukprot:8713650-Pyramimonas_sp.AAC.1
MPRGEAAYTPRENQSQEGRQYILPRRGGHGRVRGPCEPMPSGQRPTTRHKNPINPVKTIGGVIPPSLLPPPSLLSVITVCP